MDAEEIVLVLGFLSIWSTLAFLLVVIWRCKPIGGE
jgi:hypothetical protein